jgi:hypothetical protein
VESTLVVSFNTGAYEPESSPIMNPRYNIVFDGHKISKDGNGT